MAKPASPSGVGLNTSKDYASPPPCYYFAFVGSATFPYAAEIGSGSLGLAYGAAPTFDPAPAPDTVGATFGSAYATSLTGVSIPVGGTNGCTLLYSWDTTSLATGVARYASFESDLLIECDVEDSGVGTDVDVIFNRYTGSQQTLTVPRPTAQNKWIITIDYAAGSAAVHIDGTTYGPVSFTHSAPAYNLTEVAPINEAPANVYAVGALPFAMSSAQIADMFADWYDLIIPSAGGSDVDATASGTSTSTGAATPTVDSATTDASASGSGTSTGAAVPEIVGATLDASASGASTSTGEATPTVDSVTVDASGSGSSSSTGAATPTVDSATTDATASGTSTSTGAATPTVESVTTDASASGASTSTGAAVPTVDSLTVDASASGSSTSSGEARAVVPGVNQATGSSTSTGAAVPTVDSVTVDATASGASTSTGEASPTVDSVTVDAGASGASTSAGAAVPTVSDASPAVSASGSSTSTGAAVPEVVTPPFVDATAAGVAISYASARAERLGDVAVRPLGGPAEMGARANRRRILDDIRWRMSEVTRANGYAVGIKTVLSDMREVSELGEDQMPAVCVFPGVGNPPPVYGAFDFRDELLRVELVIHVAGEPDDRADMLASLEASVIEELDKDPTRGGWATTTLRVAGGDSDEGAPERSGYGGGTGTLHTTVQVMYSPGSWSRQPMRYAEIYIDTPTTTTVIASAWAALRGAWAEGLTSPSIRSNLATGAIAYTAARPLVFSAKASLEILAPAGGYVTARLAVGGVGVPRTEIGAEVGVGGVVLLTLDSLLELGRDDSVSVELSSDTGQALTARKGVLSIAPAPLI